MAAGWTGTSEKLGDEDVRCHVQSPLFGIRPRRIQHQHLATEFVGDAKGFRSTEPLDAIAPIDLLAAPRQRPVAADEFANSAADHVSFYAQGDVVLG